MKRSPMKRGPWTKAEKEATYPLSPTRRRLKQAAHRKQRAPTDEEWAWKRQIRERDEFKCQFPRCSSYSRHNDAHHIAPRSRRPDLKLELSNGITLCRNHHEWVHKNPIEAEEMGLLSSETYELAQKKLRN
jgi:hypothetical protein